MKTQKFATVIVGGLIIALVQAVTFDVTAQVTRQESTNQLKKVVYTFDPSTCLRFVGKKDLAGICQFVPFPGITNTYPYYQYLYYAGVSVPEITFSNFPSIQVYRRSPESGVDSWDAMPAVMMTSWGTTWASLGLGPNFYFVTNGFLAVLWKTEIHEQQFPQQGWQTNNYCTDLEVTNIFALSNTIVVVYETPSTSPGFMLLCRRKPIGSFSYCAHDDKPNIRRRIHPRLATNEFLEHPRQQYCWNRRPSFGYGLQRCKAAFLSCVGTMSEKSQIRTPPNRKRNVDNPERSRGLFAFQG